MQQKLLLLIFVTMKIDEEIKQRKFENNFHKALINIHYTNSWYRDILNATFKAYDIHPQHYNILRILKGKYPEPVTPGYIKEVMLEKGTDLTRLLDKLERKNLIVRRICPSNRRNIDINITDGGILLLDKIHPVFIDLSNKISKNLSEKEAETLSNLLDKLRG